MEQADVEGSLSQFRVLAEVLRLELVVERVEKVHGAHAILRIAGVERLAGEAEVVGEGAFGGRYHLVLRGLSHNEEGGLEARLRKRLGAPGTGFFPGDQKEAKVCAAFRFQLLAGRVHGEDLALGVAGAASLHHALFKGGGNVRRNGVHVGAEHHFGHAPGQKEVEGAVSHFHEFFLRSFQRVMQPQCHFPLLAGSGIEREKVPEETVIHYATIKPFSSSTWAICTALVAAPLRRLSLTHQMLRPFSTEKSRRMRPTNTSSLPQALSGMG